MSHVVFAAPSIRRYHLLERFARELTARGHRVTVLCADPVDPTRTVRSWRDHEAVEERHIHTAEDLVTRTMLLNGFTMVAIRIYEALLVRKLLHCRPDIDPTRMGLIGHSGGSGTANLVVRIESSYQALVTDRINQYWNWVDGILQDETALELYPWNSVINDFTTVEDTDVLETWYGYQVPLVDSEGSPMVDAGDYVYDEIFSYFGYHLGVPASP